MTRPLAAALMLTALFLAASAHAAPKPIMDLRMAAAPITLRWTTPDKLSRGCRGDSLSHSWSVALVYAQPRKSPWIPLALFWPLQGPLLVDSTGMLAPGIVTTKAMPERQPGDTYLVRHRGPGGLSCFSNPLAAWREP